MAITSSISLISLTYYLLIFLMCQINFSLTLGLYQYKNYHPNPFQQQQQDDRLAYFNEYFRENYPLNHHEEKFLLNDNNNKEIFKFNEQPISRLNGFKRDLRLNSQSNKRMLCFFHAVNCFG